MKRLAMRLLPLVDLFLSPIVIPAAYLLKAIRRAGVHFATTTAVGSSAGRDS